MKLIKQREITTDEQLIVDALLSGKYIQGTERLRTKHKYCCLGVACDVLDKESWVLGTHYNIGMEWGHRDGMCIYTPDHIANRLGWSAHGKLICEINDCGSLMALNDSGHTFEFIAEVIKLGYVDRKE